MSNLEKRYVDLAVVVVPFPGLALSESKAGERTFKDAQFLNSPRPRTPKGNLAALTAGLKSWLLSRNVLANIRSIDMQMISQEITKYGEVRVGKIAIDKLRVGCTFEETFASIEHCDIIAVSANFAASRLIVEDYLRYCRSVNSKAKIVVGGGDATHLDEHYLRNGADIVVRGEGEYIFRELVFRIASQQSLEGIPSISFLGSEYEIVRQNEGSFDPNPDCNSLEPIEFDPIDYYKYDDTGEGVPPVSVSSPFVSFETSRGCPWRCTFCAIPWIKGRYRTMSSSTVRKHLENFAANGVKSILIEEDNVLARLTRKKSGSFVDAAGRQELLEIFETLKEMEFCWEFANGIELGKLTFEGRIDTEVINSLHWNGRNKNGDFVGCYRQTLPIESVRDNRMELFPKLRPFDDTQLLLEEIVKTGIPEIDMTVIIRPDDDLIALRAIYRKCMQFKAFVKSVESKTLLYFNIYNLALLPGTPDFTRYANMLVYDIEKHPELTTFWIGGVRSNHFSPEEVLRIRGTICKLVNFDETIPDHDVREVLTSPMLLEAVVSSDSVDLNASNQNGSHCGFEGGIRQATQSPKRLQDPV